MDKVIIPKSIAQMALDSDWKRWAEQGWTLHQTPDGKVMAATVARHLATKRAKHLDVLITRLEQGIFSYSQFMAFKWFHAP